MTGGKNYGSRLTTPDSIDINEYLFQMVESGIEFCLIEVSSIALELHRVFGQKFDAGIFTNLTSEHLDLHNNMENYFNAKKILFNSLTGQSIAISNIDDEFGSAILKNTNAKKLFYSIINESNYKAENEKLSIEGLEFNILTDEKKIKIESSLTGRFNIYNILAAYAFSNAYGISDEIFIKAINKFSAPVGRFNRIKLPNGAFAVIDYSHTSDSLKNAIESAIEIRNSSTEKGKIITLDELLKILEK